MREGGGGGVYERESKPAETLKHMEERSRKFLPKIPEKKKRKNMQNRSFNFKKGKTKKKKK